MPNPFAALQPALHALATEGRVLPATGQAIVDMVSPDLEEAYDRAIGGRDEHIRSLWEVPQRKLYQKVQPITRRQYHRFRYFLDGSTKTYFIGTVLEHDRSSPVQLAQVGAAAVHRENNGRVRVASHAGGGRMLSIEHRIILMLDKQSLSEQLWQVVEQAISNTQGFELRSTSDSQDRFSEAIGVIEPRSRGAHRANWAMRQLEVNLAHRGIPRTPEEWLIVDGSLGNEYLDWASAPLVGVAKSFRRDTLFTIGSGPRAAQLNLYSLLAGLEPGSRTAVFPRWPDQDRAGNMVFWYVRIRPQKGLDYPLMGVVKVEMPNPGREPVDSDLIDAISGSLVAERCVTPHGRDSRWHAHLYPISIAEKVIQDRFYSEEVLKAGIKWPEIGIHA